MLGSILAVEQLLRLSLDTRIDTKVLRLVHGMAPEVLRLLSKPNEDGSRRDEAYVALGTICELTGIGSGHTVQSAYEAQRAQVGLITRESKGRKGRFWISDRAAGKGHGFASGWALSQVQVDPVELLDPEGAPVSQWWRDRVQALVDPAGSHMSSDLLYRTTLVLLATYGLAPVALTAPRLRELLGCARSTAYKALRELAGAGWMQPGGVVRLDLAIGEPYHPIEANHRDRVRSWIKRIVADQVEYAMEYFRRDLEYAEANCSPLEVLAEWLSPAVPSPA